MSENEKNLYTYIFIYNWITLLYTWNIINQLYFNLKKEKEQDKKLKENPYKDNKDKNKN